MQNLAIIVMSCDSYRDTWEPFSFFFQKHWQSCPYPIYLVSETMMPPTNKKMCYTKVYTPGKKPWSDRLLDVLTEIEESYVLLILDDFLLKEDIPAYKISRIFQDCGEYNVGFIRLAPGLKSKIVFPANSEYLVIENDALYRIATEPAVWKKDYLLNILKKGEDVWQFERRGSVRSNNFPEQVLCINESLIKRVNCVERGKWTRSAIKYCETNDCPLDTSLRPTGNIFSIILEMIKRFLFKLFPKTITNIQSRRANNRV